MSEILVKTLTRHRDESSVHFMKDWTAFDVCQIMPDGYFTKNKHHGAKYMGIVLCVDADLPQDFAGRALKNPDITYVNKTYTSPILCRSQKIIDLTKILTDQQLKDCFNHDLLVNPIHIKTGYLELFEDRINRTALHNYDKSGSFTSGTVDVGPNGHADANTFLEFESNLAATLTGAVIGITDEGGWNETATVQLAGTTTTAVNYIELKAIGAGRNTNGIWTPGAHYFSVAGATSAVDNREDYFRLTNMQIEGTGDGQFAFSVTGVTASANYTKVEKSIIRKTGDSLDGGGVHLSDTDIIADIVNNTLYVNGTIDNSSEGIRTASGLDTVNIYHNTIYKFRKGLDINGSDAATIKNNIIFGNTANIDDEASSTIDYNATDAGTEGTNGIAPSGGNWVNEMPDYATDDFSIINTGNVFEGSEITTFDDANVPSVDIIDTARNVGEGEQTSPGAFEFIVAGGETITINKGVLTITGKSINVNAAEVIPITKGAATITGQSVTTGQFITINKGSLTITGKTIKLNELITINKGLFTVTGKSVNLTIGEIVEVAKGVFTITGQDTFLNETVIIENATITITGKTVTIIGDVSGARGLGKVGGSMTMN
jgi:hypothetical protein